MDLPPTTLFGIESASLLLIWTAIMLAAVLRAFTGFGFALAAVPIFAQFLEPGQAVVLSSSLALGIGILTGRSFLRDAPMQTMMPSMIMALVGTVAGAALLLRMSPQDFQLWIGLSVIAACLVLNFYHPTQHEARPVAGGCAGMVSGLLNGAFAIPGPPMIVYVMATEDRPTQARAMLLTYLSFSSLLALLSYAGAGLVGMASLSMFLLAFPAMVIGDRVGTLLFRRFGTNLYRRVAALTLFVIGVATTFKALQY